MTFDVYTVQFMCKYNVSSVALGCAAELFLGYLGAVYKFLLLLLQALRAWLRHPKEKDKMLWLVASRCTLVAGKCKELYS